VTQDQQIVATDRTRGLALPEPRVPINMRLATMEDVPALDALQKKHGRALGFFPRAQMEGYVRNQWVLIAQDVGSGEVLGYCASRDRYLKRDELGIIYQLCVASGVQRKLVGAALVREVFERSAYGCRLYCCWCAQDLAANHFWEAMGFVPIAFRAGSSGKKRVHIFWQKRIVAGDSETKWWYPSQTNSGAIREDRLVFPIPPRVHWSDAKPMVLPGTEQGRSLESPKQKRIAGPRPRTKVSKAPKIERSLIAGGALRYVPPGAPAPAPAPVNVPVMKPKAPEKTKNDPRLVAAARELRDRWLEHVNSGQVTLEGDGKYDVGRALAGPVAGAPIALEPTTQRLLAA
jgi:hypothetical protein